MKEFKFLATPYALRQLIPALIPLWIISIVAFFYTDLGSRSFLYFFFGSWLATLCYLYFFVKRVKISLTPDNGINIFFNGKMQYSGSLTNLEYIRGANIGDGRATSFLTFSFSDKKFIFYIFETYGLFAPKVNSQVSLLRYIVSIWELEREYYKDSLQGKIYTYRNTGYAESPVVADGYNKKER
ncbi:hypothetical protein [Prevotella sp. 10(H)]|uniref:hypothetical protein n=1 Tax=Prevotella sp. 10(H) TaxID=1158294 RepID=UPI0004A71E3F|nr:hypothetical protein [Prevotella sp. 10(H)]